MEEISEDIFHTLRLLMIKEEEKLKPELHYLP